MTVFLDYDPEPRPVRVAVLGSCVTRDAFGEEPEALGYTVTTTLMRQAVTASLSRPAPVAQPGYHGLSNFEMRCLEANLDKTAFTRIAEGRPEWLLVDLIDERIDLAISRTGAVITRATGFIDNSAVLDDATHGFLGLRRGWRGVEIATLADIEGWLAALLSILPAERIILHKAYWANQIDTPDGPVAVDADQAARAHRNNVMLSKLYGRVAALAPGIRSISLPEAERIIDPGHRWGPEAFHYTQRYYAGYLRRLRKIIAPTRWLSAKVCFAPQDEARPAGHSTLACSFDQGCRYTDGDPWAETPGKERQVPGGHGHKASMASVPLLEQAKAGSLAAALALLRQDRALLAQGGKRLTPADGAALASFAALRASPEGAHELGLRLAESNGFPPDADTGAAWLERAEEWFAQPPALNRSTVSACLGRVDFALSSSPDPEIRQGGAGR